MAKGACIVKGACVVGEGGVHGREACVAGGGMHSGRDCHCSRRYASYWNAFLFSMQLHHIH